MLSHTNAIYVWGKNESGQLGLGDTDDRVLPTPQISLRNQHIVKISCGHEHSTAITIEGGLFTWGAGMYGQLGHGKSGNEVLPRRVFELMGTNITQVINFVCRFRSILTSCLNLTFRSPVVVVILWLLTAIEAVCIHLG